MRRMLVCSPRPCTPNAPRPRPPNAPAPVHPARCTQVGTMVSAAVISAALYALTGMHQLRLADCLALGAIFSATDSVATLQVGVCGGGGQVPEQVPDQVPDLA